MLKLIGILSVYSLMLMSKQNPGPEKVSLDIINEDGSVKKLRIVIPSSLPPIGSSDSTVIKMVDESLKKNGIDCPSPREKVTNNIWKCGNGKKIRTDDARLNRLFSNAWQNK